MRTRTTVLFAALAAILVACGETTAQRAVFGGATGAGTAAVLGADPVTGAAVGAAGNLIYCDANPGKCS